MLGQIYIRITETENRDRGTGTFSVSDRGQIRGRTEDRRQIRRKTEDITEDRQRQHSAEQGRFRVSDTSPEWSGTFSRSARLGHQGRRGSPTDELDREMSIYLLCYAGVFVWMTRL